MTLQGCVEEQDRIYAMPLKSPPTEKDWAGALPIRLTATGGASSLPGQSDVDGDSVHKATASCHHGSGARPIKVTAKAFYTPFEIFIRFRWQDPGADLGPYWTREGAKWRAAGPRRDGLGIVWGPPGAKFACATVCHLKDWRNEGARAFGDFQMSAGEGRKLDFWIWKAGRGGPGGAVEVARLTAEGRKSMGPEDFETPNSVLAASKGLSGLADQAFGENDAPLKTPETGDERTAPGYLVTASEPSRTEVSANATHENGAWTLTVSRRLTGMDPDDVKFVAGGEYSFGLAVIDGVARDHNAVSAPVVIRLVSPGDIGVGEADK